MSGCSRKAGAAFDKASPEIKADWDAAVTADKANDFFTAATSYSKVVKKETQLTKDQLETALAAAGALSDRMVAASGQGNAEAKRALTRLMQAQNPR
jgi:hypothetical protein